MKKSKSALGLVLCVLVLCGGCAGTLKNAVEKRWDHTYVEPPGSSAAGQNTVGYLVVGQGKVVFTPCFTVSSKEGGKADAEAERSMTFKELAEVDLKDIVGIKQGANADMSMRWDVKGLRTVAVQDPKIVPTPENAYECYQLIGKPGTRWVTSALIVDSASWKAGSSVDLTVSAALSKAVQTATKVSGTLDTEVKFENKDAISLGPNSIIGVKSVPVTITRETGDAVLADFGEHPLGATGIKAKLKQVVDGVGGKTATVVVIFPGGGSEEVTLLSGSPGALFRKSATGWSFMAAEGQIESNRVKVVYDRYSVTW